MEPDDKLACADLVQAWGYYRDQGRWQDLLALFTPDGVIAVSWFRGPFATFVERCRQSHEAGLRSKHHFWPPLVRGTGSRAVAETNVAIRVRQDIEDVPVDLTSYARFLDRIERRDGRWAICERAAIYEQDRLDAVVPSATFDGMMQRLELSAYPPAYRYMACRLSAMGRPLAEPVYHDDDPETARLYARYDAWMRGG